MKNCFLIATLLSLIGCSTSDDETPAAASSNVAPVEFPNYALVNRQDPDMPWYVSDYFRRVEQWQLETTDLRDLKLGMYELTQYPNQEPTEAHMDAADRFISESLEVARRNGWFSKEKGLSDGYEDMFGDPVHFVNVEYVFDGETLNPEKPEVLMYYKTPDGDFFLGIMFLAIGERGPQVAGPLSKWHYHIDRGMCYERGVLPIGRRNAQGSCETGIPNTRSPEMLHVWFFDHPDGRFATTMGLSAETLASGIQQTQALQE